MWVILPAPRGCMSSCFMSNACCFLWQKSALLATWTAFMMQIAIALCCNSKATQLPKRGSGVLQSVSQGRFAIQTLQICLLPLITSNQKVNLVWVPRGELRIATTASCCCYCHVCFFQVRVCPSVTRSNHLVVYAPLSFSPPFLSVSYVLIALSDWDVSLMRSVCSCSCFGCCFGGSGLPPPFCFCFCGVSSTWYYFWWSFWQQISLAWCWSPAPFGSFICILITTVLALTPTVIFSCFIPRAGFSCFRYIVHGVPPRSVRWFDRPV